MSVNKFKEVNISTKIESGDGHIELKISEHYSPVLIDTYWCDEILIWWDCDTHQTNDAVRIYSMQNFEEDEEDYLLIDQYKEPDVTKAILYIFNRLL